MSQGFSKQRMLSQDPVHGNRYDRTYPASTHDDYIFQQTKEHEIAF